MTAWRLGINGNPFTGEVRALDDMALPAGAAQLAVNVRMISGALGAYHDLEDAEQAIVKSGSVQTVYLMDADGSDGGPYLLHWTSVVDVVPAPVADASQERLYLTSAGQVPSYTTLFWATDTSNQTTVGAYPYVTLRLGVPAPTAAPSVSVDLNESAEDQIPLTNAGAESGLDGWTSTEGAIDVADNGDIAGLDASVGNRFFTGGTDDASQAYQSFLLSDYDLIASQPLTLNWQQATGAYGSTAAMGLQFYNATSDLISEQWADPFAPATALTWESRSIDAILIPDDTVTVRVTMRMEKVGSGDNDAYIDDITVTAGDSTRSYDGSSLDDWTTSVPTNTAINVDTTVGRPAPSYKLTASHSAVGAMYMNLATQESPLYEIVFDYYTNGNYEHVHLSLVLDADDAGAGNQINFDSAGVKAETSVLWNSLGTSSTLLDSTSHRNVWFRATVTVELANGKKTATIKTVNLSSGVVMAEVSTSYTAQGSNIGFKGWNSNSDSHNGWLDNVSITIQAPDIDAESTNNYTDYVTVFVNADGDRSAPSDDSRDVTTIESSVVTVTPDLSIDSSYNTTDWSVELYRFATIDSTDGYYLVASKTLEALAADPTFVDTTPDTELGRMLETDGYDLPPEDGVNVVVGANGCVSMWAPSDNQRTFSPLDAPQAAPELWRSTQAFPEVGAAVLDNYLFSLTTGPIYLYDISDPENAASNMRVLEPMPCAAKLGVVVIPGFGIVYPSNDGPAMVNANGVALVGLPAFDDRAWQALLPSSIRALEYQGNYIAWFNTGAEAGGFVFDPRNPGAGVTSLDWYATAAVISPKTGRLHVVVDGKHQIWDEADGLRPYDWRSGEMELPYPVSLEACALQGSLSAATPATVTFYYDGALIHTATVESTDEFLLPDALAMNSISIGIAGTATVRNIRFAEAMEEL